MSQMGWEKGKGLGANEQGDQDPIKVRMNIESRGTHHWSIFLLDGMYLAAI